MEMELLALVAEIASISAAGHQLKKPIKVPRPKHVRRAGRSYQHADSTVTGADASGSDPYKRGVSVLARTTRGKVLRA